MKSKDYIDYLQLQSHPEGGYYSETYRSNKTFSPEGFSGLRAYCTSIYFLLEKGQSSALHRIKSDEIWNFHAGGTLEIIEIDEQGNEVVTPLGLDLIQGERPQHVVKAGRWFGAHPAKETEFVLVGCQVSPGFDYRDWEMYE